VQINLICAPEWMSAKGHRPRQNGGNVGAEVAEGS